MMQGRLYLAMFRLTTWFLLFGTLLAVMHATAIALYLYAYYWWFDIVMHFLGGMVVLLALGTLADLGRVASRRVTAPAIAFGTLVFIMVAWEVFEYVVRVSRADNFALDTTIDLIVGFLGGVLGWLIIRNHLARV